MKIYEKSKFNSLTLESQIWSPADPTLGDITGFGSAIEKIDFDGDNLTDLVIGAPLWTKKDTAMEGAVYIYLNKGSNFGRDSKPDYNITGSINARFGTVIKNIGDLNKDGIDDLAIGAYGENKVYIYHGRREKADQVCINK